MTNIELLKQAIKEARMDKDYKELDHLYEELDKEEDEQYRLKTASFNERFGS